MKITSFVLLLTAAPVAGVSGDWPMWGRTPSRNMTGPGEDLPVTADSGEVDEETEKVDLSSAENIRWAAKLGSQSYGNPVAAFGKVFVGTNNESPRDPGQTGDRGTLMAFDEKTGKFLWQLVAPKLGAGKVSDWEYVGICSAPAVEEDRLWLITNRGEVVCLDINGQADGNQGPFKDEGLYMAAGGKRVELSKEHADILWRYDMREELGVFPHNVSSCSPLVVGDTLYTATSNGVDWSHTNIPAPLAPGLIALDKNTGKLLGEEVSGVSERVLHASWSSPAYGKAGGRGLVVWGGGDGFVYGFEPEPVRDEEEDLDVLREVWRYDANPPEYRIADGKPIKYARYAGPSEVIGTPVLSDGLVYVAIGQDPEHGDGVGMLSCIDASKRGDLSGKAVWTFKDIGRSISTPSVADGLVFQAEFDGEIHCLDAMTGQPYWKHETLSRIWGSTLVADGKVFIGTEDGELVILAADKKKKELGVIEFPAPIHCSPIVANDTLYIATDTHLYAVGK